MILITVILLVFFNNFINSNIDSQKYISDSIVDNHTTDELNNQNNQEKYETDSESNNLVDDLDSNFNNANNIPIKGTGVLELFKNHSQDNVAFNISNMLPGDLETRNYCIRVSYTNDVTVRFRADIKEGYEKFAEVMKCKVILLNSNEVLYDGLMKEMPESINYTISSIDKGEHVNKELYYSITSYLDTSVGNEYQNKKLVANFKWWTLEEDNLLHSPYTRDDFNVYLWFILGTSSIIGLIVIRRTRKNEIKMKHNEIVNKLTKHGIISSIIICCLCITTFALVSSIVSINDNVFTTGNMKINLNDGKPVISENEILFKPGMTIKREFFIKNESSFDVYHKLYVDNIKGNLNNILEITVKDDEEIIYSGNISEFNRENAVVAKNSLKPQEKREFSIYFYYPENLGNNIQNNTLSFDLCADAVQSKNNPNKNFN